MLNTTQSTRIVQPSQGVLSSESKSKVDQDVPGDVPGKGSFSKLFSAMRLETSSEASTRGSQANALALAGEESAELMAFPQLNESEDVALSVMQQLPVLDEVSKISDSNLTALDLVDTNSDLPISLDLESSSASEIVLEGLESPLMTPIIESIEGEVGTEAPITSFVASNEMPKSNVAVEGVNPVILQDFALNKSSGRLENPASAQLSQGVSNAASNSVTSWGTQAHTAVAGASSGDVLAGSTQGQGFTQGGQSGQNPQGQSGQQQAMMFAQFIREGKVQSLEQQAAVRAVDESTLKSDGKDLLGGAEIASADKRGQLPLGLQSIQPPLKHPQWGQALAQRVVFMANNSIQQAQITLNPEKLGQIQVTLQLDKDQKMNVSLNAHNGSTRESIENAMPKLREMLEQAGITLGSMDVSDQKQFSGNDDNKSAPRGITSDSIVEEDALIEHTLSTVKTTDNIVDYYA